MNARLATTKLFVESFNRMKHMQICVVRRDKEHGEQLIYDPV